MCALDTMTILRCFGVVIIMKCLQIVESGRKICLFLMEVYKPNIKLSNIYKSFLNIKKKLELSDSLASWLLRNYVLFLQNR